MCYFIYLSTLARTGLSDKAATSHTWLLSVCNKAHTKLMSTLTHTRVSYWEALKKCVWKNLRKGMYFFNYTLYEI